MAPSKKKKKAAANPARGFATVSLPSKGSAARQENDILETQGVQNEGSRQGGSENASNLQGDGIEQGSNSTQNGEIQNMSPEELDQHLQDSELQSILDEHGSRCKADAARQVARLEAERRTLRSQATKAITNSWLPDVAVDDILRASRVSHSTSP